jgi:hypothetical protein
MDSTPQVGSFIHKERYEFGLKKRYTELWEHEAIELVKENNYESGAIF